VIVSGCLAERQREDLLASRPEIDSLIGVFARDEVTKVADRLLGSLSEQRSVFRPAPIRALSDRNRLRVTPRHFAYLKISEGCDRLCTFCSIPRMRGKHVSKSLEEIHREAEELAADGVRELILVAQARRTTAWTCTANRGWFPCLTQLQDVPGIDWIRLMYLYPQYVSDDLIETIAGGNRILPYIDLPLQHISEASCGRMSRRVTRSETESLIGRLRERIPNLVLRTTLHHRLSRRNGGRIRGADGVRGSAALRTGGSIPLFLRTGYARRPAARRGAGSGQERALGSSDGAPAVDCVFAGMRTEEGSARMSFWTVPCPMATTSGSGARTPTRRMWTALST